MQATASSPEKDGRGLASHVEHSVNTWEADVTKILSNVEMSDLAAALGTGLFADGIPEEEVEAQMAKLRYGKVVILADADIDGCFTGDTHVLTVDGPVTFEQLVADHPFKTHHGWAFDQEAGHLVEVPLAVPRVTKETDELVEVELDNGHVVRCTPDHQFLLKTGEWVQAQFLQPDMEIEDGTQSS